MSGGSTRNIEILMCLMMTYIIIVHCEKCALFRYIGLNLLNINSDRKCNSRSDNISVLLRVSMKPRVHTMFFVCVITFSLDTFICINFLGHI